MFKQIFESCLCFPCFQTNEEESEFDLCRKKKYDFDNAVDIAVDLNFNIGTTAKSSNDHESFIYDL